MTPEEAALVEQALRAAEGCARRLERSRRMLAPRFPLTAQSVEGMSPEVEDELDAFMKRFEQLVSTVQDELFKAIALLGGEDTRSLARREVTELMERLGALPSAARFRALVAIRNRIAHVYPDQPGRQAENLNQAGAAGTPEATWVNLVAGSRPRGGSPSRLLTLPGAAFGSGRGG